MQTQPSSSVIADNALATAPVVQVLDVYSNLLTGSSASVDVSWPLGGVAGTHPMNASGGLASFGNLILTNAGTTNLVFSSSGLAGTTSSLVTVIPQAATKLVWATPPGGAVSGSPFTTQPVIITADQFGNPSTNGLPASLIVTVSKTAGGGSLIGSTNYDIGTSAGNGTVTGSGLGVQGTSGAVDLTASVPAGYGTPVAGMSVWLDASDTSTVSGSSPVSAWNDKSGNAKHFTTTIGASGSITYAATVNGRRVVTFPNGKGLLNSTYTNGGPDTTFFVMMRHTNAAWGLAEGPLSTSSGGSDEGSQTAWGMRNVAGQAAIVRAGGGLPEGDPIPANDPFIWSGAFDFTGDRYLVGILSTTLTNEVEGTPNFSGNFAINQVLVGGRLSAPSTGNNWCNGDIGEVLIYNTFLSDADRDSVKAYLSNKWLNASSPPYASIASATTTVSVAGVTSNTISGVVQLEGFVGTNRMVRFVMSEVSGGVTNYLQTNDVVLNFAGGNTVGYNLSVPTNTTHISAKTAWHLRRRLAVGAFSGGAATVDFSGGGFLRGGDLITDPVPPATIENTDNSVNSADYLRLLNSYLQTVGGDANIGRADIDGDGGITSSDYLKLLGNYLATGDPQ
jgi:hypothetical protein